MITNERKGFTLIEILIVVAIIAILASIVLVGLGPTQQAGRDARRLSDLHETQNGLELYYNKCGYYPGPPVAAGAACGAWVAVNTWAGLTASLIGTPDIDVSQVPVDPTAGATYEYISGNGGSNYMLAATLENKSNSVFTNYTAPANGLTIPGSACATASDANKTGVYCVSL